MLLKLSLVVALCSNHSYLDVQKKVLELQKSNPGTEISVRVDKKSICTKDGMVLSGKQAKLYTQLGK